MVNMKKILFGALFLAVAALAAFVIYSLFFRPAFTPAGPEQAATTTPGGGFPAAGTGEGQVVEPGEPGALPGGQTTGRPIEPGIDPQTETSPVARGGLTEIKEISSGKNLGATLGPNGSDIQFYNRDDGHFYKVDKNGNVYKLSDETFYNVQKVTWSPSAEKAILEYPDGANIIYNFDTDKQISLPRHWEDFDFSPKGDQIVFKSMGLDKDNRWLSITNEDASEVQLLEGLGENGQFVHSAWSPNNQSVAMYVDGVGMDKQEVYFVGKNNENFKSAVIEGRGFQPLWSPDGEKLLYSTYTTRDDMKPNLWIINAKGGAIGTGRKSLDLQTWAEKCAYADGSTVYCAVPESLEAGAGIFPELGLQTKDRLYSVDTSTGVKKLVAVPDGAYNMSDLVLSENGYYLYFTDQKTGKIHQIKLK